MTTIRDLAEAAVKTFGEYALCDHCMGRIFSLRAGLADYTRLGKRLRSMAGYAPPKKCHVCKGVFAELGAHCDEMVRLTSDVEFSTFLVGATLKPSVLDADDNVRARYALRGTPGAKSDVTATLSKMFSRRTGARPALTLADITLKVDLRDGSVSGETRPVFVQARYTKESRTMPQKADRCGVCAGRGCMRCAYRGTSGTGSVENSISGLLCDMTGSRQARFLWLGSEDAGSTVSGNGRPFIAKLVCPSRRRARLFRQRSLGEGLVVHDARYVASLPKAAPRFSFTARIRITTDEDIDAGALRGLRTIAGDVTDYGTRTRIRKIHSSSYKRTGPRGFQLVIRVDSGFPLRRFVESSSISPNVTDVLEVRCRYDVADFADIELAR